MSNNKEYTEMTADAKVGLLLGLVFIAIIAFVINGLPNFVDSVRDKAVVETAVTTQTGGNLVIEPAVVDVARSLQEKRTTVRYVQPPVDTTVLDQYAGRSSAPTQNLLPSGDTAALGAGTEKTPTPEPTPAVAQTQESQSPAVVTQIEKTAQAAQQTANPIQQQGQLDNVAVSKPLQKPAVVPSHVVQDGESLGEIAKKYYGEEEGNKLATIQMLYEANKNILESPDKIQVGNQLVIPKIKSATASQPTEPAKKETAAGTLLDKFKSVFTSVDKKSEAVAKGGPAADKTTISKPQAPAANKTALLKMDKSQPVKADKSQPVKGATEYTVQSGDYLYKIAQKQLGDGDRYPEIVKLNKETFSESNRLHVGMKLKIPKQ
jgi:nucleoid-associated protein YgaU